MKKKNLLTFAGFFDELAENHNLSNLEKEIIAEFLNAYREALKSKKSGEQIKEILSDELIGDIIKIILMYFLSK